MNTFTKAVFLTLAASAAAASNAYEPSDSAQLNAANFEEELPFVETGSNPRPGGSDGSNWCTWAPDYECYKEGWPRCCLQDQGSPCPYDEPPCDNRRPNPRPTRRPTRRPSSPNRRPPTRRPTRRPTRNPTRRPTTGGNQRCVDDRRPRPVRNGQRFRFNLIESESQCVDDRSRRYEWGRFDGCQTFSECAEMCVNNVPASLAMGGTFRGYDFDCDNRRCDCLYDTDTLDGRNGGRFDRTNRNENGQGSIVGTVSRQGGYCGKLVGAELLEDAVAEA